LQLYAAFPKAVKKLLLSAKLKNRTKHLSEMPVKRYFGLILSH
jgi:hypothetical protein